MHKQFQITICIFLTIYFQMAQAYKIYRLYSNNDLVPKIKEILENRSDNYEEYNQDLVKKMIKNVQQPKPLGKSILVKRIIPHGYRGAEYEYDTKLKTVFKPLIRFHVQKPAEGHKRIILQENEAKKEDSFNEGLIVLVKKDRRNPHVLLQKIKGYLKQNEKDKKRKKNKKRFRGINKLDFDREVDMLRYDEEKEDKYNPLAPGKMPDFIQAGLAMPGKEYNPKKVVFPYHTFWNYWTGHKTIVQDECKGHLIKVGNMCINSMGHRRKNAEPIKKTDYRKFINYINTKKYLKPKRSRKYLNHIKMFPNNKYK